LPRRQGMLDMPKRLNDAAEIRKVFADLMKPTLNKMLYKQLSDGPQVTEIDGEAGVNLPPGYRLIRVDGRKPSTRPQDFEIAMVNDVTESVVYYNHVIVTKLCELDIKPATQSLVWRSPDARHRPVLRDLASNVFFNYILDKYNALLSDGNQTSGGQFFWESQVSSALSKGKHVYFYKMMSAELETVPDQDTFDIIKEHIWGDTDSHEHNLMLISNESLPKDAKYVMPVDLIDDLNKTDVAAPYVRDPSDPEPR